MSYFCMCGPIHLPDCTLGSTGGATITSSTYEYTKRASIEGWKCPECKTIYAPHVDKCECMNTTKRVEDNPFYVTISPDLKPI